MKFENLTTTALNKLKSVGMNRNCHSWVKLIGDRSRYWNEAKFKSRNGKSILIATSMGCYNHASVVESALGVALTIRGANVEYLFCDSVLPCCQMTKISNVDPKTLLDQKNTPRCKNCINETKKVIQELNLTCNWFSSQLDKDMLTGAEELTESVSENEIKHFKYNGVAVGEHAYAGALRYFARGDLEKELYGSEILKRYLKSAILTAMTFQKLLNKNKYDVAVFHHGIYVPQGIIGEVCRMNKIDVVNWNPSYRKKTFIFSHNDTYHHTMVTESVSNWQNLRWTRKRENKLQKYLKSRWRGNEDWIWFHEKDSEENVETIYSKLNLDLNKPVIGLLTSVMWDAQLHYKDRAFKSMLDWVFESIEYFSQKRDLQLVIRVHPAEIRGMVPSRQKIADEIAQKYEILPENVHVIAPEDDISTYAVMEICNAVIIYNTKMGIEISSIGIPVIVCGEAWVRNKGFTIDVNTPQEYTNELNKLPYSQKMNNDMTTLARKYAYHFFFNRMIELPFIVSPEKYKFRLNVQDIKHMDTGKYKGLDIICNGILFKSQFMMESK